MLKVNGMGTMITVQHWTLLETLRLIQAIGLNETSSSGVGWQMSCFGASLKVVPTGFPSGLGMKCESKEEMKDDSKVIGLSFWKDGVAIILYV